jgi:ferrous iron transport protein A|tara:strand:- start:120 stop:341 length:222 start_codon:yes stop_codon:yes gene_type:complete
MKSLADLKISEKGIIKSFSDEALSIKLIEMGCLPGSEIQINFTAPFNGPIAIKVAGYHLSLRKEEAQSISLED